MRRAAVSIPANIAEGAGRRNAGDFSRFVRIALGSMFELDTLLEVATQLEYVKADAARQLRERVGRLMRGANGLIRYQDIKRRQTTIH